MIKTTTTTKESVDIVLVYYLVIFHILIAERKVHYERQYKNNTK